MCGIAGGSGRFGSEGVLQAMVRSLRHRGPDDVYRYASEGKFGWVSTRLAIIDLSENAAKGLQAGDGRWTIAYNGEVYNYLELRKELSSYPFLSETDTEVVLAAYLTWGPSCLRKFIGMFAFAIWDSEERRLFCARDRFGVKPLYYAVTATGDIVFASEIKTLHVAGVPKLPSIPHWTQYLLSGLTSPFAGTFWSGIRELVPGHTLTWNREEGVKTERWYDVMAACSKQEAQTKPEEAVAEELSSLLEESVRLRFRSDVPVGVCLSGGFDSSLLIGLIGKAFGREKSVDTFTFACGDPAYDETPWVREMLAGTEHRSHICPLEACEVPMLAERVQRYQDEPYGGLPTLGMAKVHQAARDLGVVVLLDGNGLDEAWAGYDYYQSPGSVRADAGPIQGSKSAPVRPNCVSGDIAREPRPELPELSSSDPLCALQCRDIVFGKIPRAMRFADRVSMMFSRELREPFLDHRIVELGLRQPSNRKIRNGIGKWLPRRVAKDLLPRGVREAPKRPVQTPQREWLRGPLRRWAEDRIENAIRNGWGLLDPVETRREWRVYLEGRTDNSFFVWQWISLGMMCEP